MATEVASSSSEDEGNDSTSPGPTPAKQSKQATKKNTSYQCPADFVTFPHEPCCSTLSANIKDKSTELWLIKAPASFNPRFFNNVKVPTSGLQTIKASGAVAGGGGEGRQIYSVLANPHGATELHLLTSNSRSSNEVVCAPPFRGLLNVCESYGDCSPNQSPQSIPAAPAPRIPSGLKLRFQPFGSKTPTIVGDNKRDDEEKPNLGPGTPHGRTWTASSSTGLLPPTVTHDPEEVERRKKKKKKKKDKRREEEETQVAVLEVKQEPVFDVVNQELLEGEKRKKKKKKKDKEKGEAHEEGVMAEVKKEVQVKEESMDSSCPDLADGRKKKKKKKSKTIDN